MNTTGIFNSTSGTRENTNENTFFEKQYTTKSTINLNKV